jgi:hypothetical protein
MTPTRSTDDPPDDTARIEPASTDDTRTRSDVAPPADVAPELHDTEQA